MLHKRETERETERERDTKREAIQGSLGVAGPGPQNSQVYAFEVVTAHAPSQSIPNTYIGPNTQKYIDRNTCESVKQKINPSFLQGPSTSKHACIGPPSPAAAYRSAKLPSRHPTNRRNRWAGPHLQREPLQDGPHALHGRLEERRVHMLPRGERPQQRAQLGGREVGQAADAGLGDVIQAHAGLPLPSARNGGGRGGGLVRAYCRQPGEWV
jgi:hypothetical protein